MWAFALGMSAQPIPDKELNPVVALELLRHVPLLHLVAPPGVPERTCPAGNKDCFV